MNFSRIFSDEHNTLRAIGTNDSVTLITTNEAGDVAFIQLDADQVDSLRELLVNWLRTPVTIPYA